MINIEQLYKHAQANGMALVNGLYHTTEEKRLIIMGYMCGFCDGNLENKLHSKTEQSGENESL